MFDEGNITGMFEARGEMLLHTTEEPIFLIFYCSPKKLTTIQKLCIYLRTELACLKAILKHYHFIFQGCFLKTVIVSFYFRRPLSTPSSAGLERVFSSMGHLHSEIRNSLKPEKVRKPAFCMRWLNSAPIFE